MIKSFRKNFVLTICLLVAFASLNILTIDSGVNTSDDKITIDVGDLSSSWSFLLTENVEKTPTAADCYRFVLSNPSVDVCMMGVKNQEQLQENMKVLESEPLTEDELNWMRRVGDHVYQGKSKK